MKVNISEDRLYQVFKKFIKIRFSRYTWLKNSYDTYYFVAPDFETGCLEFEKDGHLYIYNQFYSTIRLFFHLKEDDMVYLIKRYVEETLGVSVIETHNVINYHVDGKFLTLYNMEKVITEQVSGDERSALIGFFRRIPEIKSKIDQIFLDYVIDRSTPCDYENDYNGYLHQILRDLQQMLIDEYKFLKSRNLVVHDKIYHFLENEYGDIIFKVFVEKTRHCDEFFYEDSPD